MNIEDRIRQVLQGESECVVCTSFEVIETITTDLMQQFFIEASGVVFSLVSGFLTLYVIWKLTLALMGKAFDYSEMMAFVLRAALVAGVTAQPAQLFSAFFLAYDFGIDLASRALLDGPSAQGFTDLLAGAEASIRDGLGPKIAAMFRDLSFYRVGAMLAIITLVIPLLILAWEMVKYFFRPMFVTFAIGMMLPILMGCIMFDRTVSIAVNALKVMVSSSMQLVLAASVISFMIVIMGSIGSVAETEPTIELFGTFYFTILLITVTLIFLFPVIMQLPETIIGIYSGGGGGGQLSAGAIAAASGTAGGAAAGAAARAGGAAGKARSALWKGGS